jgi:Domain of unknown function (DUF4262)
MDARTRAFFDQHDAHIADIVRRFGWFIQYVGGDSCDMPGCDGSSDSTEPPFAYTVGLFGLGHAELLVVGVSPGDAAGILNTLGRRIRDGETLLPGEFVTFDEWPHRIVPETVPNPGEILFESNRFYDRPDEYSVPALQLSYDDTEGRFPWEDGYATSRMQPMPGTFKA